MDPKRVEEGVWFLLRGLGIGVYTGDGQQILPGSETGPTDFWIYDFEFPLIVRLAVAESSPFSEFQKQLDGLGWSSSQDETLTLYKGVYDGNSTAYLPRLHAAMGLRFEGDPEVTPLQEWLLLLDTFLPPNGSASIGRGRSIWMSFPGMGLLANARLGPVLSTGVSARPAQPAPCGWIQGGTFHANWGLVNAGSSAVDLLAADTAYYAIHGPLLARSIGAELKTSEPNVHEGHGAPGETVTFDVAMDIDYRIGGIIPIGSPTCGYLINLDPPLGSGELPPAHIWWRLGPQFKHHGSFRDVRNHVFDGSRPTETDPSGRTAITFEAREEPANGQGELMSVDQRFERASTLVSGSPPWG
ncbi:MAG TPA: hypothetical protein VFI11_06555 [Anaerolineales bacterium]|nr:hypothetical protein [Anaerolineales bacterium]